MLRAVLFDLDDTLVIADNKSLMREYFSRLAARFSGQVDPQHFQRQLIESTLTAISVSACDTTFLDRFSEHFFVKMGLTPDMDAFMDFYASEYAELGRWTHPAAGARAAVETAKGLGLHIVVATNPVFPKLAIDHRLAWAGLSDIAWDLITTGEEMHTCKPHAGYFQEIATRLNVAPQECLMVGNDPENDLPAGMIGMRTFLVTSGQQGGNEALQTFSGNSANSRQAIKPDYVGSLLDLPSLLPSMVGR